MYSLIKIIVTTVYSLLLYKLEPSKIIRYQIMNGMISAIYYTIVIFFEFLKSIIFTIILGQVIAINLDLNDITGILTCYCFLKPIL